MGLLQESSIDWALQNCSRTSDFFPRAFEYEALTSQVDAIRKYILSQDVGKWKARPSRRLLAPKGKLGFRVVTELDPLDNVLYAALVYEIGAEIEVSRTPDQTNTVFSHRFKPDASGRLFESGNNYTRFRDTLRNLAQSGRFKFVAVSDISDFFPRLYEHRLENALSSCVGAKRMGHARAIINLLKQWNAQISSGIPIGSDASRLLSEAVLCDIDRVLELEGATYCRWCDDFFIFCETYDKSYKMLSKLANSLNENHNLNLNESKTRIMTAGTFIDTVISPEARLQFDGIRKRFSELLSRFGEFDPYTGIAENELELEGAAVNEYLTLLDGVVSREVGSRWPNYQMLRFIIGNLRSLRNYSHLASFIALHHNLYPISRDIAVYVQDAPDDFVVKSGLGQNIMNAYRDPIIECLEFSKMWLMDCFVSHPRMADISVLAKMFDHESENIKREILLVFGNNGEKAWIGQWKRKWQEFGPWTRRSFLSAAGCLADDEREHFFRSLKGRLDPLEQAIVDWRT